MNALKVEESDQIIDNHIKGVLNGIAAALPIMERQCSGHIINTASTGAHAVGGQFGVYRASNYAVRAISEGLQQEMDKIRVTVLSPGVTTSEPGARYFGNRDGKGGEAVAKHCARCECYRKCRALRNLTTK